MKNIFLLLVIFFPGIVFTQSHSIDFNNYQIIRSQAPIPDEFLTLSSEAYLSDKATISKKDKAIAKKAKKQFYLESNFYLNQLLHSGKVLFNDPLSTYVEEVANELLKDDPKLRAQLRFYVVRSSAFNAFATDRGTIVVTVGLLAKIESEAQLAYILAHEITHVIENHTIEFAVESAQMEKLRKLDDKLLAKSSYSQDQELEADHGGLELFLKSDYHPSEAMAVLELMATDDLPFLSSKEFNVNEYTPWDWELPLAEPEIDDAIFDTMYSDTIYLVGKKKKIRVIEKEIDFDSLKVLYSTHPSLPKRIEALEKEFEESNVLLEGEIFILPELRFKEIRKIVRYEICRQFLAEQEFEKAIWAADQLLEPDGNSNYWLNKIITRGLYGMAKYASGWSLEDIKLDTATEKELQLLSIWMEDLSKQQKTVISVNRAYIKLTNRPYESELELVLYDVLKVLHKQLEYDFEFETDTLALKFADTTITSEIEPWLGTLPKLEQWKSDINFMAFYTEAAKRYKEDKAKKEDYSFRSSRNGKSLGIKEAIVLDPFFIKVNEKKRNPIDYLGGEKSKLRYQDIIEESAEQLDMKVDILAPYSISADQAEEMHDIYILQNFIQYELNSEIEMVPLDYLDLQQIQAKRGMRYLICPGAFSISERRRGKAILIYASIFMPPLLPYSIFYISTPQQTTLQFAIVYDLQTGKKLDEIQHFQRYTDSPAALRSGAYYNMMQISGK